MAKAKSYMPQGSHTVTPHVVLKDCKAAFEFYKKAFDAQELYSMKRPDGGVLHAALMIGDSQIYFSDEMKDSPCSTKSMSAESAGSYHATLHLYVKDVDETFKKAVDAGAKIEMPVADMFWGDRYGFVIDPFGQPWSIATHVEDIEPADMEQRKNEAFKQFAASAK